MKKNITISLVALAALSCAIDSSMASTVDYSYVINCPSDGSTAQGLTRTGGKVVQNGGYYYEYNSLLSVANVSSLKPIIIPVIGSTPSDAVKFSLNTSSDTATSIMAETTKQPSSDVFQGILQGTGSLGIEDIYPMFINYPSTTGTITCRYNSSYKGTDISDTYVGFSWNLSLISNTYCSTDYSNPNGFGYYCEHHVQ